MPMGGGAGHRHVDSKDFHHHHHHHLHRAANGHGGGSGGSTGAAASGSSIALAWPSCWRRARRPLLLVLGALGAVALILRVLGASEQQAALAEAGAAGGRGGQVLSSSASASGGQRRPGPWAGSKGKEVVKDPSDPGFRPLEIAPFPGRPWRTAETLSVSPVVATPFGVCEIHRIRAEDGTEIDGWLWFDEKDQVNVLARLSAPDAPDAAAHPPQSQQQPPAGAAAGGGGAKKGQFLLFEQRKYGFEGLSLAPIGGLVEPGEEPLAAAKRELLEEAGLISDRWTVLGRYRISSTRGGGFLNVFLADDCRASPTQRASDDMEKQTRVFLSAPELAEACLQGRFKEAKWTQTVAMALLHLLLREREAGAAAWAGG